jgi:hypothetical protein
VPNGIVLDDWQAAAQPLRYHSAGQPERHFNLRRRRPHHPEAQQAERRRCEANSGVWRAACGTGI